MENALELTHGCVKKRKKKERRRQESLVDFTDPMDWNHSEIKFQIVIFFYMFIEHGKRKREPK